MPLKTKLLSLAVLLSITITPVLAQSLPAFPAEERFSTNLEVETNLPSSHFQPCQNCPSTPEQIPHISPESQNYPIELALPNHASETYDINVFYYNNPSIEDGQKVYLVHGFAHNAKTYFPLIDYIFAKYPTVDEVYAIDLPGHGESFEPFNSDKFSDLGIHEYVEASLQVLKSIGEADLIIGHSLGGMVVQLMEQRLNEHTPSTSFATEFGTESILLIGSVLPRDIPWNFVVVEGNFLPTLMPFLNRNLCLGGWSAEFPNADFREIFFNNISEEMLPDEKIEQIKNVENLKIGFQMAYFPPRIDDNLFSEYQLASVAYNNDFLMEISEERALHEKLGGNADNFYAIFGDYPAHDGFYLEPHKLKRALNYLLTEEK